MAYFPNSTAADMSGFTHQCSTCPLEDDVADAKGCPIALAQMLFNYDQIGDTDAHGTARAILGLLVDDEKGCMVRPQIDGIAMRCQCDHKQDEHVNEDDPDLGVTSGCSVCHCSAYWPKES